ncbi:MAG: PQQ-binding-like beta-propeller repeat protein [Deltaproteobacteria bacterium]|nr:PQQ-binding-like beta-propeller repeat protein [Deltaproteobacteria bacterium]
MLRALTPPLETAPARRVQVAWQVWFDGLVERTPIALADGVVVVVDHAGHSEVRRIDESGQHRWQVALEGRVSGDPARTRGCLALPWDGVRVVGVTLESGAPTCAPLAVPGLVLHGGIAALRGHVLARFASAGPEAMPFLAIKDPSRHDTPPTLVPDPLGVAIEARFRATNHTCVLAGEDPAGFAIIAGLDLDSHRVRWSHRVEGCGLSHLWAAGGLVDVVLTDRLTSLDARTGTRLTTRFEGMVLDAARIAGEALLVTLGHHEAPAERLLLAFDTMTEAPLGEHKGLLRLVGACSDECLVADLDDRPTLLELPSLLPIPIRDGADVVSPRLVAWSRHRAYVVGHDGHSLSAIDLG